MAVAALRLVVEALADDDTTLASAVLDQVSPNHRTTRRRPSPPASASPSVCSTTGWAAPTRPRPHGSADRVRLPNGHWQGERAARDILALARKGRAFRSLGSLITRQGGPQVLYGSALALAATIRAWSNDTGTPVPELARTAIR